MCGNERRIFIIYVKMLMKCFLLRDVNPSGTALFPAVYELNYALLLMASSILFVQYTFLIQNINEHVIIKSIGTRWYTTQFQMIKWYQLDLSRLHLLPFRWHVIIKLNFYMFSNVMQYDAIKNRLSIFFPNLLAITPLNYTPINRVEFH